uniref:uncharacterized protein LOC112433144 n=1 Tax=Maylandia zebra TaxID=106582 RepID=UPI000D321C8C|nr:uncharacterized protein LOC112433144 [Maylandia zebra]
MGRPASPKARGHRKGARRSLTRGKGGVAGKRGCTIRRTVERARRAASARSRSGPGENQRSSWVRSCGSGPDGKGFVSLVASLHEKPGKGTCESLPDLWTTQSEAHRETRNGFTTQVGDPTGKEVTTPEAKWVWLKVYKRKWDEPRWTGPFEVTTRTSHAVQLRGKGDTWYHWSQCAAAEEPRRSERLLAKKGDTAVTPKNTDLSIEGAE